MSKILFVIGACFCVLSMLNHAIGSHLAAIYELMAGAAYIWLAEMVDRASDTSRMAETNEDSARGEAEVARSREAGGAQ